MIITKKEFKDAVKNIIVDAIKSTNDPMFTKEENKEADRNIATAMTDFYSRMITKLFAGREEWEANKEELSDSMNQCSDERIQKHPSFTTALENIACITSVGELLRTITGNEEEETQEPQEKEFDVEEILREAGSEQE